MTITVTQPKSDAASSCVEIVIDGVLIGAVGPGESIDASPDQCPYEVRAVCGSFIAVYHGNGDVRLRIQWRLQPARMELEVER